MKTLHVIVSNKVATYLQRDGYIVCGNSDYQVEFAFSSEWAAYERKVARFIWGGKPVDVEFSGKVCPVPILANTEQLKVGVYVGEIGAAMEPEKLHTTTSAVIPCRLSVLCDSKTEAEGTVVIPEGTPVLGEATISENGEHYPGEGYDGFYKVTVKVPTEIPEGYIKPKGTKPITENGTHDVTKYAAVEVNVPTGSGGEQYLGEYVDGTGYKKDAIVSYEGNIYICIKDLDDMQDPTNANYWQMLNEAGSGEDIPEYNEVEDFKLDVSGLDTELEISYSVSEKVALPAGRNILSYTEDENFTPSNIKKGVSIFGLTGTNSTPAEISTEAEMTALLTSGEIGGVYKYTGPTGTYENGALYVLEATS